MAWRQHTVGRGVAVIEAGHGRDTAAVDGLAVHVVRLGQAAKRTLTAGGLGSVGEKAAAALADFIVLDMFANVCTGREDAKGAIKIAERQALRVYR